MLDRLYHGDDFYCISKLRMREAVFFKLCQHLRENGHLEDTIHCTIEEQVAMFLNTVGLNQTSHDYFRSEENVSLYFNAVLNAIGHLAFELIKIKSTYTHVKVSSSPNKFSLYFEDCIGVLDSTDIPAFVPACRVNKFIGRKNYPTQKVLAAVDFDLCFTFVSAGWEGSVVLGNALQQPTGCVIPRGKFFLADAGYAARPGILPPYCGVRYHLEEYGGDMAPETLRELFNYRHSLLRTTLERAVGTVKNQFKILISRPFYLFPAQIKVVFA